MNFKQLENLFDRLVVCLDDNGCKLGEDRPFARRILSDMGFIGKRQEDVLLEFEEEGGFCDCEIVINALPRLMKAAAEAEGIDYRQQTERLKSTEDFSMENKETMLKAAQGLISAYVRALILDEYDDDQVSACVEDLIAFDIGNEEEFKAACERGLEEYDPPTYCADCGIDTMPRHADEWEYYVVKDHVWEAAGAPTGPAKWSYHLCIGCLESRLGRKLRADDFTDAPINEPKSSDSPRLADRKRAAA